MQCIQRKTSNANPYLARNVQYFVKEKFKELDSNNCGTITAEEASVGLSKCGYRADLSMIEGIMRMCDDNNDHKIDIEEFMRIVICLSLAESRKARIYMFFVAADKDLSGTVSKKEFNSICGKLGITQNREMLERILKGMKKDLNVEQYLINIARLQGRML